MTPQMRRARAPCPGGTSRVPAAWRSLAVAFAAALVLAGCAAETAPAPKSERPVQIQRVTFESTGATREFVGVVRARHETDLGFRVGGKIIARVVNVGDQVHAGDVIARLDPQDLALQVESAEAELAAATSNLAQASADLQRYTTLKARGYAAVADFDRKQAANDEAEGPADAGAARARSRAQSARLCRAQGRRRRRHHRNARRARPGRRHRPGGGAARPSR